METLVGYVAATIPPGGALTVQIHLAYCAHCRATVRFLEAVGGALLQDLDLGGSASTPDIEPVLAAIETTPVETSTPPQPLDASNAVASLRHGPWRAVFAGVEFADVEGTFDEDETVCMLKGAAGSPVPTHGHERVERFVVLEGGFGVDDTVYYAGDFIESDASVTHTPFIPAHTDCLCLFALEGGLVFPEPEAEQRPD